MTVKIKDADDSVNVDDNDAIGIDVGAVWCGVAWWLCVSESVRARVCLYMCIYTYIYIYIYNTIYIYIYINTPQGSLGCMKITPGIPGGDPGIPRVYEDHPRGPWGV